MKNILNNPYRILGLKAGISTMEKIAKLNQLRIYLRAGEEPPAEGDFLPIKPLSRTIESVEEANRKLETDNDRMNAAMFWFYLDKPSDSEAFYAMANSNLTQADKIWKKLTESNNVDSDNWSAFQNRSTLLLYQSLQHLGNITVFKQGLTLKLKFLESDFSETFVRKVTDITFHITKADLELMFLRTLMQDVEEANNKKISLTEMITEMKSRNFEAKESSLEEFATKLVAKIKNEVEATGAKREQSPILANQYVSELLSILESDLKLLESISINETAADSVAEEIMNCAFSYFNAKYMEASEHVTQFLTEYRPQTIDGAISFWREGRYKGRETLKKLENIENATKDLLKQGQEIAKGILIRNHYQDKKQSHLISEKDKTEIVLQINSHIVSQAQDMIIKDVHNMLKNITKYNIFNTITKISSAISIMEEMEETDLSPNMQKRLEANIDSISRTIDNEYFPEKRFITKIKQKVENTAEERKKNPAKADSLANSLYKDVSGYLNKLKNISESRVYYESASNSVAQEILESYIAYYVYHTKINDSKLKQLQKKTKPRNIRNAKIFLNEGKNLINEIKNTKDTAKKLLQKGWSLATQEHLKQAYEKNTKTLVKTDKHLHASSLIASKTLDMIIKNKDDMLKNKSEALRITREIEKMELTPTIQKRLKNVQKKIQKENQISGEDNSRYTKISGIKISGRTFWAFIKFNFCVTLITTALLAALEYKWQIISSPSNKFEQSLPLHICSIFLLYIVHGIISLIKRKLPAFAIFLSFITNTTFLLASTIISASIFIDDTTNSWLLYYRIAFWLLAFAILIFETVKIGQLQNTKVDSLNLNASRLQGKPGTIYFTCFFRSLLIPYIAFSIVTVGNLSLNPVWSAIFSIYGFLWAYNNIRIMLLCNALRLNRSKASEFLYTQHLILFLPELALFLIYYFDWLPMPKWVVGLFIIYGFFWILSTIGILIAERNVK
jgi:hypothetical protein